MPPPNVRQPDQAAIDSLVAWLEDSLDRAAAAGPSHLPDQVVLHRLNRKEYTTGRCLRTEGWSICRTRTPAGRRQTWRNASSSPAA
jgi:hypothetical protein